MRGVGGRCYWTLYCAHCTCVLYHVMCRQCRHHRHCTLPLYTQYMCTLPRCRHSHDDGPLALACLQSRQENMKQLTLNLWVERENSWVTRSCSAEAAGQSWVTRNACKVSKWLNCWFTSSFRKALAWVLSQVECLNWILNQSQIAWWDSELSNTLFYLNTSDYKSPQWSGIMTLQHYWNIRTNRALIKNPIIFQNSYHSWPLSVGQISNTTHGARSLWIRFENLLKKSWRD